MSEELPFQVLVYSESKEAIEQPRNDLRNSKGGTMQFDLSHLYHEKTIDILNGETVLFQVTVGEIPSGEAAEIQNEAMQAVDTDSLTATTKKGRRRQMTKLVNQAMKEVNGAELTIREILLGVKRWTLLDANGAPVPVCVPAYRGLPKFVTKQIDDAVEEFNPEPDEEFQDNS